MKFSQFFRSLRERAGLTREAISKVLDVHISTIDDWERDVSLPSEKLLTKISRLFRIQVMQYRKFQKASQKSFRSLSVLRFEKPSIFKSISPTPTKGRSGRSL